jgi:hypothetical protein
MQQNPELVGFLLHPISRSETWRRLITLQVRSPLTPGAECETELILPGGRVDQRKQKQQIDNGKSIPDQGRFLKGETPTGVKISGLVSIS